MKCLNEDIHANLNGVLFTHTLKEIKYKVTNVKEANLQLDTRLKSSQKGILTKKKKITKDDHQNY